MSQFGYSGLGYDRHVEHQDNTTLGKMKERYWVAKQLVRKRLGKKEDDCVILCDAALDAKLETFQAIATSCIDLLQIIEEFQENVADLAEEENSFGKFIQEQAKLDHTRAGKLMAIFGKSQLLSAYHRIQLQTPLQRMYQDICTFHQRAVKDTFETIEKMEKARLQYRAALLWMKDISQNLDPDTFRQLEKFRKVQSQVKKTRTRFERLKFDSIQKIDLLAASRCNMFSNSLVGYQNLLIQYCGNTARVLRKVSKSFNGYQFYEFNKLKQLTEISRKLASEFSTDQDLGGSNINNGDQDLDYSADENDEEADKDCGGPSEGSASVCTEDILNLEVEKGERAYEALMELATIDLTTPGNGAMIKAASSRTSNGVVSMLLAPTKTRVHASDPPGRCVETGINKESPEETVFDLDSNRFMELEGDGGYSLKGYMPSHLLDTSPPPQLEGSAGTKEKSFLSLGAALENVNEGSAKKKQSSKAAATLTASSSWLDKFADLDPLANPDLVGYMGKESDILDRNC